MMEPVPSTLGQLVLFYVLGSTTLLVIPGMFSWWVIAQWVNAHRRDDGRERAVGRWHFLRFGPAGPLISAAASLFGFLLSFVPGMRDAFGTDAAFVGIFLAGSGLVAFLMSMLLWSYASDPGEPAERHIRKPTASV